MLFSMVLDRTKLEYALLGKCCLEKGQNWGHENKMATLDASISKFKFVYSDLSRKPALTDQMLPVCEVRMIENKLLKFYWTLKM